MRAVLIGTVPGGDRAEALGRVQRGRPRRRAGRSRSRCRSRRSRTRRTRAASARVRGADRARRRLRARRRRGCSSATASDAPPEQRAQASAPAVASSAADGTSSGRRPNGHGLRRPAAPDRRGNRRRRRQSTERRPPWHARRATRAAGAPSPRPGSWRRPSRAGEHARRRDAEPRRQHVVDAEQGSQRRARTARTTPTRSPPDRPASRCRPRSARAPRRGPSRDRTGAAKSAATGATASTATVAERRRRAAAALIVSRSRRTSAPPTCTGRTASPVAIAQVPATSGGTARRSRDRVMRPVEVECGNRRHAPESPASRRDRVEHHPRSRASSSTRRRGRRPRCPSTTSPSRPNAIARRWSWWVSSRAPCRRSVGTNQETVGLRQHVGAGLAQFGREVTEPVALLAADEADAA